MIETLHSAVSIASLALSMFALNVDAHKICSIPPSSYVQAKSDYPHLAYAIEALEENPIAVWYTDRLSAADRATMLQNITSECSEDSLMTIVVYGLPNKDCQSGVSTAGSVDSTAAYKEFLNDLTTGVGDRKVLYIIEPDAAALQVDDTGCGEKSGYLENLKIAIEALAKNANAELYLDLGYWTLMYEHLFLKVIPVVEELNVSKRLRGIVLNTRNYRSTSEMVEFCAKFRNATQSTELNCIIDTSRNYVAPQNVDHCNILTTGIGAPPTSETNFPNVDYLMWIEAPGESGDARNGAPEVGVFYEMAFEKLWNQGYLVQELGMKSIEAESALTPTTIQSKPPMIQSRTLTTQPNSPPSQTRITPTKPPTSQTGTTPPGPSPSQTKTTPPGTPPS